MNAHFRKRGRSLTGCVLLVLASLALGCPSRATDTELERVEFGVLYGGDIQDREVIPLEFDTALQELALRITFRVPLERESVVAWELERPAAQRATDGGALFTAELGEIRVHAGEQRAETKIAFRRGDLPGAWRLSVRLDGRVVLERSFTVSEQERR